MKKYGVRCWCCGNKNYYSGPNRKPYIYKPISKFEHCLDTANTFGSDDINDAFRFMAVYNYHQRIEVFEKNSNE